MERAVLFLYDAERRLVLPAGSHGVYREFIVHGYGTLEETPIAQRALAEDRVAETTDLARDVPARYSNLPGVIKLTCTPVAAAGRWLGVIFADRDGQPFELTDAERSTMYALGRTAALASHVREVTRQLERSRRLSEPSASEIPKSRCVTRGWTGRAGSRGCARAMSGAHSGSSGSRSRWAPTFRSPTRTAAG